jgi:hypothetical protein
MHGHDGVPEFAEKVLLRCEHWKNSFKKAVTFLKKSNQKTFVLRAWALETA